MPKENGSYLELCELTTAVVMAARDSGDSNLQSRTTAFREACARRPDLARTAIGPDGQPVALRPEIAAILRKVSSKTAASTPAPQPDTKHGQAPTLAEEMESEEVRNSPLVKMAEQRYAGHPGRRIEPTDRTT